jgi:hypothetical protein
MKYETPKLVALPLAVDAIQGEKGINKSFDLTHDVTAVYEDWE